MKTNPTLLPSQSYLQDIFDYDPETGILSRNGYEVGFVSKDNRVVVKLHQQKYYASRLIWKLVTGENPDIIDHIDGNSSNNKFTNLRNVTQSLNSRNKKSRFNSTIPIVGISWRTDSQKYIVQITNKGKQIHIGRFHHALDAIEARLDAEEQYGYCYRK